MFMPFKIPRARARVGGLVILKGTALLGILLEKRKIGVLLPSAVSSRQKAHLKGCACNMQLDVRKWRAAFDPTACPGN